MLFPRNFRRLAAIAIVLVFIFNWQLLRRAHGPATIEAQAQYPLLSKYIEGGKGNGGGMFAFPDLRDLHARLQKGRSTNGR